MILRYHFRSHYMNNLCLPPDSLNRPLRRTYKVFLTYNALNLLAAIGIPALMFVGYFYALYLAFLVWNLILFAQAFLIVGSLIACYIDYHHPDYAKRPLADVPALVLSMPTLILCAELTFVFLSAR